MINKLMKKLMAVGLVSAAMFAEADTEVVGGIEWTYTISDGEASVGGGWNSPAVSTSTKGDITIPSTLGECPVTSIGDYAFKNCRGLTSVTIPASVTDIGELAFYDCSGLTGAKIPSSVTSIGWCAFFGCSGLTTIYVGMGDSDRVRNMILASEEDVDVESKLDFTKIAFVEGEMPQDPEGDDGAIIIGAKVSIETEFAGYKATGLPKGLSLSNKGVITGTAKTAGEYTVTFTKKDAETVTKVFVVRKENEPTVECPLLAKGVFTVGVSGAEGGIPLEISAESGVKSVTAKNLPAGMKVVQDKTTKEWSIQGGATKAGSSQVTLTVTTMAGAKVEEKFEVTVSALPDMAIGTFNGFVNLGSEVDSLPYGTLQVTTTDAGKITAKVTTAAKTYSFSATCWDAVEGDDYSVKLSLKTGETLSLALASKAGWNERQLTGEMTVGGSVYAVSAQRNAFGKTWYFDVEGDDGNGWTFTYAANPKAAALTLSLGADGKTSIAGKLGTLKVSASGFADVSGMSDGAIIADFAPVVTVNKSKMLLSIRANLWFDRSNNHDLIGSAMLVK